LQAEYSWAEPGPLDTELNLFTDKFAAVFYDALDRDTAHTIASAYRELDAAKSDLERNNYLIRDFIGVYDVQDKSYSGNDLMDSLKLIDALAAHPAGPGKTIEDIRQRSERAAETAASWRRQLAAVAPHARNAASMQYLIDVPHRIENHARRTLFLLDLTEAFRKLNAPGDADRQSLGRTFSRLQRQGQELQDDTRVLADEMDELTAPGPDASGCHKALAALQTCQKRLADARNTLAGPARP
jgi:hypothetical protein